MTRRTTALFLFLLASLFSFPKLNLQAYTDEILTTRQDVWTALKLAVKPENIRSADEAQGILKTRWLEDVVHKEKNILPDALGRGVKVPNTVKRRYRMQVQLTETKTGTQIQITGKYQERPFGAPEHQARWKTVKPVTEDYELERVLFFKVISELTRVRISQS